MSACDFCKNIVDNEEYTLWLEDENGKLEFIFGHENCVKKYEREVLEI